MKITVPITITSKVIANLMISAIEGNHMTRAWCVGVRPIKGRGVDKDLWYSLPEFYASDFLFEVREIKDESKDPTSRNIRVHKVTPKKMIKGLGLMASKAGNQFGAILSGEEDGVTADVFLQTISFGEHRYG